MANRVAMFLLVKPSRAKSKVVAMAISTEINEEAAHRLRCKSLWLAACLLWLLAARAMVVSKILSIYIGTPSLVARDVYRMQISKFTPRLILTLLGVLVYCVSVALVTT